MSLVAFNKFLRYASPPNSPTLAALDALAPRTRTLEFAPREAEAKRRVSERANQLGIFVSETWKNLKIFAKKTHCVFVVFCSNSLRHQGKHATLSATILQTTIRL